MRLDKFISSVTDLSRSEVKKAIRAGRVRVAGELACSANIEVLVDSSVELDGEILRAAKHRYFMLNKPPGYVCASKDRTNMTVLELLDEDNLGQLHAAGRLDIDTTGLVLLTDDGQWSHRITSPRSACKKSYLVETVDPIGSTVVAQFAEGVQLQNEKRPTLPAELELFGVQTARLTLSEGKYHQVKRMFAFTGNRVESLHRERIGAIALDSDLLEGEYRPLSPEEVASV